MTPADASCLTEVPGVRCVALEPRESAAALAGWRGEWQPCDSPQALARVVAGLDAVVSVDTMAAHLAGALGVPTCTLLACDADWRWMHERDDTPWYPTMRLFRQPAPGVWAPVLADVARHLAASAATATRAPSMAAARSRHARA
jgi:ADP-heptose:LPS heptosyltransferase